MPPTLRAMTLYPEWAWCIRDLDKRDENRSWPAPESLRPGDWLAIHAGARIGGGPKKDQEDALEDMLHMARGAGWTLNYSLDDGWRIVDITAQKPSRGIVHVDVAAIPTRAIVALARYHFCDLSNPRPWTVDGEWHWHFSEVRTFESVPCRGAMGLWTVPADVAAICFARAGVLS